MFPMSIDILEIQVKIHFLLIFDLKTIIFPLDDAEVSKFIVNIWLYIEESESGFQIFWSETNEPKKM